MITVGLVGAGFMGEMHANCYASLRNAKVVGVADIEKKRSSALASKCGAKAYSCLDSMVKAENPDVIDITLPTFLHCEYVTRAAKLGKHVLCEKPMASTVAEADRMIAATKKARVKFMVAHCLRFWPEYVALKRIADSKKLGKITSACFARMSPTPDWGWKNWLLDPKKSGSALVDLHIHDTDFILYLLGKPRSVSASAVKTKIGYSHVYATYDYPDKAVIALGGWDLPPQYPFNMSFRVNFEKGVVEFDSGRSPSIQVYEGRKKPYEPRIDKPTTKSGASGGNISDLGGYFNEINYFLDCIEEGKSPKVVTPKDARNSLAVVLAEQRSAASGRRMRPSLK